jgi:hypothetical protein
MTRFVSPDAAFCQRVAQSCPLVNRKFALLLKIKLLLADRRNQGNFQDWNTKCEHHVDCVIRDQQIQD